MSDCLFMLSHILVWKRAEAAQNIDKKTILPDVYMVLACKYGKSLIKPAHDSASDAEKTLRPSRHLWNDWIQAGLEGENWISGICRTIPGIFVGMVPGFSRNFSFYRDGKRGNTCYQDLPRWMDTATWLRIA